MFGHTHKSWVHDFGGVRFVNCGSVGKPRDGDPRGASAILRHAEDTVDVTIERIAYDADAVAAAVRVSGLPAEFADKLLMAPDHAVNQSLTRRLLAEFLGGSWAIVT